MSRKRPKTSQFQKDYEYLLKCASNPFVSPKERQYFERAASNARRQLESYNRQSGYGKPKRPNAYNTRDSDSTPLDKPNVFVRRDGSVGDPLRIKESFFESDPSSSASSFTVPK